MTTLDEAIRITDLKFGWKNDQTTLAIPSLVIEKGSRTFLKGDSGSGKSTLLGIIAGILLPQSGSIEVFQENIVDYSSSKRDKFRAEQMGIIFQMFNLLPYLSICENICLPCRFSKSRARTAKIANGTIEESGKALLNQLGLDPNIYWSRPVSELSVGQQQRVAAARALIGGPNLVIADEPTSALDTKNRDSFINLLSEITTTHNSTLLFVSHDESLANQFEHIIDLSQINQFSGELIQ